MQRHEEKYLIDYRQYALLKSRAAQLLTPDVHGGSYVITSLYYDDLMDTALLEKQDGLATHTKFRVRTYNGSGDTVKLERKVKRGILTEKQSVPITRQQISQLGISTDLSDPGKALAAQMLATAQRPAITVRYRRDAYFFQGSDLRLTFDTDLRVLPPTTDSLFDCTLPGIPALDANTVIMEVKYGSHLPAFVRNLIAISATQLSVSKYALCREILK